MYSMFDLALAEGIHWEDVTPNDIFLVRKRNKLFYNEVFNRVYLISMAFFVGRLPLISRYPLHRAVVLFTQNDLGEYYA